MSAAGGPPLFTRPTTAAAGRLDGKPSAVWLEGALAAERDALARFVDQRHCALLAELGAKLADEADVSDLQSNIRGDGKIPAKTDLPCENAFAGRGTGTEAAPGGMPRQTSAGYRSRSAWEQPVAPGYIVDTGDSGLPLPRGSSVPLGAVDDAITADAIPTACSSRRLSELKQQMGHQGFSSKGVLAKMVADSRFELAQGALIMCNALVICCDIQYEGIGLGKVLEYRWYENSSEEAWPGGRFAMEVLDYAFGIIFTIELVVKVLGQKSGWLRDAWNYLDAAIVGLWLIEKPFSGSLKLPADATILRTARLFRVLRLMKLLRTLRGLDSLYLMLTTLRGCVSILGWSVVVIFVTQMLITMLFWFVLSETYFRDEKFDLEERQEVFKYFGTWTRAMLTVFEMTLANWPPVCRLLVENVNEWFSLFCILHKLTMGFAVIGVINGVFMQETFSVTATDDKIMLRHREREVSVHTAKMNRLFRAADESGDGFIDIEEFKQVMQDKDVLFWLSSMELPVRDPVVLYEMLDVDGDGELTCEELVRGALMLRGSAKAIDVLEIKRRVEAIKQALKPDGDKPQHTLV